MSTVTKEIPLSKGLVALVDEDDFARLCQVKWHASQGSKTHYAKCYKRNGLWATNYMHRIILGATPGLEVDHRNHNGLDNRRANLRIATHRQNSSSRRKTNSQTSSRYIGVHWFRPTCRWMAQISCSGEYHYLGYFDREEDAALTYDEAAKRLFGEFACLNFPKQEARCSA